MANEKHLVFLTGKTMPDVAQECKDMERGKPKPPQECYLCKRTPDQESVALTVAPNDTEPSLACIALVIDWVEANNTPDAKVFFPLCQDCRMLLDMSPDHLRPSDTTAD